MMDCLTIGQAVCGRGLSWLRVHGRGNLLCVIHDFPGWVAILTSMEPGRQVSCQAGKQASRQAGKQASRPAGWPAGWGV